MKTRYFAICLAALLFSGCDVLLDSFRRERPAVRFLLPDGYVGWVRVDTNVPNAPPLPTENRVYVARIPPIGRLETSTKFEEGWAADEFYYVGADGRRIAIPVTPPGAGGRIWGMSDGAEMQQRRAQRTYTRFYVGPEAQFKITPPDPDHL